MRGRSENASNREWESDSGMSIPERSIILRTVDHSENDRAVRRLTSRFSEPSGHSQNDDGAVLIIVTLRFENHRAILRTVGSRNGLAVFGTADPIPRMVVDSQNGPNSERNRIRILM